MTEFRGKTVLDCAALKAGTFEFPESVGAEDVHPHGSQLFFSDVNFLQRSLVLGQLVDKGLRLKQEESYSQIDI